MPTNAKLIFRTATYDANVRRLSGTILEIGCGSKLGFPQYTERCRVVMIDKCPRRIKKLNHELTAFPNSGIEVKLCDAASLPYPDGHFDAVVGSFVLCSVADVPRVLREMERVPKRSGQLLLLEHIKSPLLMVGKMMDLLTPLSRAACNNCHLNRPTLDAIKQSAFNIVDYQCSGKIVPWIFVSAIRK
jgi:ubiquinone/menaquinone biosynthesis C-methylase UbiE